MINTPQREQNRYITKKQLYRQVTRLIYECGFSLNAVGYRVDSVALAPKVCRNLEIKHIDFESAMICGILVKTEKCTSIALNNRRGEKGKNFDCMHELMHYWLHDTNAFYCMDKSRGYFEWQANEGAAQFLMPYQVFIPRYVKIAETYCGVYEPADALDRTVRTLSDQFMVGERCVKIRVNSLRHEIEQYKKGIEMENISVFAQTGR